VVEVPVRHDDEVDRLERHSHPRELGRELTAGAAEGMLGCSDARVDEHDRRA
jgi:hypothetical protein